MKTPLGVALISVMLCLGGIIMTIIGIAALALFGFAQTITAAIFATIPILPAIGIFAMVIMAVIGIIITSIGVGFGQGKTWAWWIVLIVNAIGIISSIFSINPFALAIDILIVIYLLKQTTQRHFSVSFPWSW